MKVTIKDTNVPILQVNRSQNPKELDFKVCAEKAAAQEDAEDAFNHGVARGTLRGTVRGTVHGTAPSTVLSKGEYDMGQWFEADLLSNKTIKLFERLR